MAVNCWAISNSFWVKRSVSRKIVFTFLFSPARSSLCKEREMSPGQQTNSIKNWANPSWLRLLFVFCDDFPQLRCEVAVLLFQNGVDEGVHLFTCLWIALEVIIVFVQLQCGNSRKYMKNRKKKEKGRQADPVFGNVEHTELNRGCDLVNKEFHFLLWFHCVNERICQDGGKQAPHLWKEHSTNAAWRGQLETFHQQREELWWCCEWPVGQQKGRVKDQVGVAMPR